MTAKVEDTTMQFTAEERLRLYTVEQVIEMKLLPYTERTLRIACNQKRIPHTLINRKIRFRLADIHAAQEMCAISPATRGRRRAA
ncbi:helix-turn-helix domain-containing protein [Kitasatospora cineracea]|uniref:helix-turn-helix domain-containing protein n=1 Tax=Kitasatospora cineracea TaxID=88074 RepID=UPI0037BC3191